MSVSMDKRSLSSLGFTLDTAFFVDSIIGLGVGITIVSSLGLKKGDSSTFQNFKGSAVGKNNFAMKLF